MPMHAEVDVRLADSSYSIHIGPGVRHRLPAEVAALGAY